jgi:hypothetical protein
VVRWCGEWCICVWWDGVIVENVPIEGSESVEINVDWAGVLLLEHVPEYSGFVFEYVREL